jgi:hypothetical protein
MDLRGYELSFHDTLEDYALPQKDIDRALAVIKNHPKPALLVSGKKY